MGGCFFLKSFMPATSIGKKNQNKTKNLQKNPEEKQTFLLKIWNIRRMLEAVSFSAADNKSTSAGCWQFWSLLPREYSCRFLRSCWFDRDKKNSPKGL